MTDCQYLHAVDKATSEGLLLADGGAEDPGKFLVRYKGGKNDSAFILSVVYKGQATHHQLTRESDGDEFTLNKAPTGETTLDGVLGAYRSKRPKWPVPLTTGVSSGGSGDNPAEVPSNDGGGAGTAAVHVGISKSAADKLLGSGSDGTHLVRSKGDATDDFILSVIYKGGPTHHQLSRKSDGAEFTLNKSPTGETTIDGVLQAYRSKRPKWPVPLTDIVRPEGSDAAEEEAPPAPPPRASQPTPVAPAAPAVASADSIVHEGLGKGASEALLGSGLDGKHLVRCKPDTEGEYIITVIYKGKPTHHQLVCPSDGAEFTLNKQPTGETTIAGVLQAYRSKRPKWPVPLTDIVRPEGGQIAAAPAAVIAAAPAAAIPIAAPTPAPVPAKPVAVASPPAAVVQPSSAAVTAAPAAPGRLFQVPKAAPTAEPEEAKLVAFEMSEYFHAGITQPDAEAAIKAHSASEGTFLLRDSTKVQNDFVLSMLKGGRVVHHGLVKANTYKIDGLGCGPATTLLEVIEWASTAQPGWNVPLRDGVPGLTCASDEEIVEQQLRIDMQKSQAAKPDKIAAVATMNQNDMFAKMQARRAKQEAEEAEQAAKDREFREERARAAAEAKATVAARAAAPKEDPAVKEAARQKRLQDLAALPQVSSYALSRAANVELSDESSSDDEPPIMASAHRQSTGRASMDDDEAGAPKDAGYLDIAVAPDTINMGPTFDEAQYMHGEITKADADALLIEELENDPLANGKFLIRKQGKDNLILSLLHNNVPTHHLIAVDDDGCYSVSGQPTEQTTIASMLVFLSQTDVKWWQTPLRGVVPPQEKVQRRNLAKRHSVRMKSHRQTLIAAEEENESTHSPSGSKREAKKSIKRKTHSKTKLGKSERNELQAHALEICAEWEADATGYEAGDDEYDGGMRDSGVVDEADSELGPYFHRGIDKDVAEERLGSTKGNFLMRFLNEGDLNGIIITAVFKGQATHHLLTRSNSANSYEMNNLDLGVNTVEGVIAHLGERHPYWPLRLLNGIPPPRAASKSPMEHAKYQAEKEHARRAYLRTQVRDLKLTIADLMGESVADAPGPTMTGAMLDLRTVMARFQTTQARYAAVVARQQAAKQRAAGATAAAPNAAFQLTKYKKVGSTEPTASTPQSQGGAPPLALRAGSWKKPPTGTASAAPAATPTVAETSFQEEAVIGEAAEPAADTPSDTPSAPISDADFIHTSLGKAASEELLVADGGASITGKFLIRAKGNSAALILSVIYKGSPTHHQLAQDGGEFTINKQPTGQTTLAGVVEHLGQKRPKWPVPLTEVVLPGGGTTAPVAAATTPAAIAPTPATPAAAEPVVQSAPAAASNVVHSGVVKSAADAMLVADGGSDGKHLVRSKAGSTDSFILSVIYRNTPTHHVLAREADGAEFTLNKQPTGETTIEGVLRAYRSKRPKWPVALTDLVRPIGGSAAKVAKASVSDAKCPFLHTAPLKKSAVNALLLADNGAEVPGKFLVWSKGVSTDEFILAVIYKGNATHHPLVREAEGLEFTLNGQPTTQTTVAGVCDVYREKRPKWPVPLTEGVRAM